MHKEWNRQKLKVRKGIDLLALTSATFFYLKLLIDLLDLIIMIYGEMSMGSLFKYKKSISFT